MDTEDFHSVRAGGGNGLADRVKEPQLEWSWIYQEHAALGMRYWILIEYIISPGKHAGDTVVEAVRMQKII
jgi:hypothetical protein